jgi:outer membrane protein OmpA-like peptidoglycan-associated protein
MDPVDSPVVDSPEILAEAQAAAGGYAGEGNAETPTVGVQEEETVTGPARAGPEAMDESGPDEEVAQIDVPPRLAEAAAEMDEAIDPEEAEAAILTTATPDLVPGELRAGVARDSDPSAAPAEGTRETPCVPLFVAAFDRDSERPRFADREAKVKRLSAWLVAHPRAEVIVEGHTDAVGSPDYNLLLSERRAQAVAEMLMGAGVPADQLVVRGFGETVPLEGSSEARQHRRVSFRVTGYQACPSTPPE